MMKDLSLVPRSQPAIERIDLADSGLPRPFPLLQPRGSSQQKTQPQVARSSQVTQMVKEAREAVNELLEVVGDLSRRNKTDVLGNTTIDTGLGNVRKAVRKASDFKVGATARVRASGEHGVVRGVDDAGVTIEFSPGDEGLYAGDDLDRLELVTDEHNQNPVVVTPFRGSGSARVTPVNGMGTTGL